MKKLLNLKNALLFLCMAGYSLVTNAQSFEWAKSIGSIAFDIGWRAAVDGSGNVYVTGHFVLSADFNPGGQGGMLTSARGYDGFLVKYDPSGTFLWAKSMGGFGADESYGVAVDGSGNVYVTGSFSEPGADFNPGGSGGALASVGYVDAFLAKYDSNGIFLWAKNMGSSRQYSTTRGQRVAVDGDGNVYMTGYFDSPNTDFNIGGSGGMLLTSVGMADVFLAKYDSSGTFLWVKSMGGNSYDQGLGVAADGSGNVYITGYFNGAVDFDPGAGTATLTSAGNDVFVAKYDPSGNYLWAKRGGGTGGDQGTDVAVDGSGNVFVTGTFAAAGADFNPGGSGGALTSAGRSDVFLARYDSSGTFLWARSIGGSSYDEGWGLALDGAGNAYVTGWFDGTADFNPGGNGGMLTSAGSSDAFLAKYDPSGTFFWAKGMGGTGGGDQGWGVAVDGSGNVYGTGAIDRLGADFNPGGNGGKLTSVGEQDIFVVKFVCGDTSSSYLTVSTCEASYMLNDSVYTASGTYAQIFPNVAGCDSTVKLDLAFYELDPVIAIDSFTLSVPGTYDSYQWLKDGIAIPGATDSAYQVTENAGYQVIVTNEFGCTDTSDIYDVTNVSTETLNIVQQIKIYPNPAHEEVYIQSPVKVNVRVTDIAGKTIKEQANAISVFLGELSEGIYFLSITDKNGALLKVEKLVKAE